MLIELPAEIEGEDLQVTAKAMKPVFDRFWQFANYKADPI